MKPMLIITNLWLLAFVGFAHSAEPIKSSQEAIAHVVEVGGLDLSENARLVSLYEKNRNGLSWNIVLRDGDSVHRTKVAGNGEFELMATEQDSAGNNVEFWAKQGGLFDLPTAASYAVKARSVLESFDPNFSANPTRYQSTFRVCEPKKADSKSSNRATCKSPYIRMQSWRVRMMVDVPDGKSQLKEVVFVGNEAEELLGVSVRGAWRF